jgi:uncharacterized protein YecT (DUF1311 family)
VKLIVVNVILTFVGCSASLAQSSEQYGKCVSKANTQMAMNACANEEVQRADGELNKIYQKLLSSATGQSGAVEKIRAAERTWIAYRDAYIDAMCPAKDKQATYGSRYPMDVDLLRAKLIQQQTVALKDLLTQRGGSKQ